MRIPPAVPVLALPGGVVRLGVARPLDAPGLGAQERAFLATLEGGREITASDRRRMQAALAAIEGALEETAQEPALRIAVVGPGALPAVVARCLTSAGGSLVGAEAMPQVAVVVALASPDASAVAPLLWSGVPHVVVATDEDGAWVSHVVDPGTTACSRCRDVARTREDPAWPSVVLQCATRVPVVSPVVAHAAAALVTARVLDHARSGAVGTGLRVRADGTSTPAPCVPEAACGCGAAGPIGDEVAARRARMPR